MLLAHTCHVEQRACALTCTCRPVRASVRLARPVHVSWRAQQIFTTVEKAVEYSAYVSEAPGPAFRHALGALDWGGVCGHVASFAATLAGKRICEDPEIAVSLDDAVVRLLATGMRTVGHTL